MATIHAAISTSFVGEGEQGAARDEDENDDYLASVLRLLHPLAPGSEGLKEAIVFVNTEEVQQPSYEQLMAYTQELKTSSRLLAAKFMAASAAQPRAPERTRISPAKVFGLPGSAIGPESLRMAKTKHD